MCGDWQSRSESFPDSATASKAMLKLDFVNAFNTVHRDSLLEAVAENLPKLMAYVSSSYECPTSLALGDQLSSNKGVQQNESFGPLLFSMALDEALKMRYGRSILRQYGCWRNG